MTDNTVDSIVVYSEVNLADLAYNLEAKGIDTVKQFIKQLDDHAADCDFTHELYLFVCDIWNKMNEELISAGEKPAEGYEQKPISFTINITNPGLEITKNITKVIKEQEKRR